MKQSPGAALAAMRKSFKGGRPVKPTACPRCQALCTSSRAARAHCRKKRITPAGESRA